MATRMNSYQSNSTYRNFEETIMQNFRGFTATEMYDVLQLANLKHSLTKVLPFQHTQETLSRLINTMRNTQRGLECTIMNPFLQILLVFLGVHWTHVLVRDLFGISQRFLTRLLRWKKWLVMLTIKPLILNRFLTTFIRFLTPYASLGGLLYCEIIPQATMRPKSFM